MTTFINTSCQSACDNLGKLGVDIATQLANISLSALTTDLTTEITRIQALTDSLVNPTLGQAWAIEAQTAANGGLPAGNAFSWLNSLGYSTFVNSKGPWTACDALDFICAQISTYTGLTDFLAGTSVLVDQYTADIFNGWVAAVTSGAAVRKYGTAIPPKKIPSSSVFPHANVDYVNQWTASGATTGTLAAGSASLAAISGGNTVPGFGILEAYAGNGIGASAYTIQVTYTNNAGQTGQTMTFSVTSSATIGTVFTPSGSNNVASIQSVAVTVGSATSGDIIKFRLKPVRSITA